MKLVVVAVFLICGVLIPTFGQGFSSSCSYTRMTECKERLRRNTQKRINDMSRADMMQHCGIAREDFNCLLSETRCITSDSERQRNADTIRDAYVYLRDGCDTLGENYRSSSCFTGTAMRDCESSKPFSSGTFTSYNSENCRDYNNFFKCVTRALSNQCRPEDDVFIGQYLVAKAQDLAWNCKDTDMDDRSRDRDRDWNRQRDGDRDRERDYGRYGNDRQNTERDRSRERDSYRPDGGYDRDRSRYSSDRNDRTNYGNGDVTCCQNEVCDRSRMSQCKDSLTRTIDNRGSIYQDARSCRKVRDDFNCALWQSTCLPREERDRMSDIFHRARDFLSRQCDTHGSFSENSCYKSSDMQRCETYLSTTRNGASYESCSAYTYFRECMEDELRRRCTRDDQLFQGQYLVEKAQEMAWQCPNEDSGSRSRYSSSSSYDRRPGQDYNSAAAFGAYNRDEPPHLDDEDEMCRSRMQSSYDICKRQLDEKRRLLITEHDYDVKQRQTCCSARQFKTCLFDATRRVCHQEKRRVVDSFLGRQRYELESDNCKRVYDYDCNASISLTSSSVLVLLLAAIVSYVLLI